jgi:hypothetical protein
MARGYMREILASGASIVSLTITDENIRINSIENATIHTI